MSNLWKLKQLRIYTTRNIWKFFQITLAQRLIQFWGFKNIPCSDWHLDLFTKNAPFGHLRDFQCGNGQISSDLLKKAFATWQLILLYISTTYYDIFACAWAEIIENFWMRQCPRSLIGFSIFLNFFAPFLFLLFLSFCCSDWSSTGLAWIQFKKLRESILKTRLRVVPLSLSPSCVTRKKTMKKMAVWCLRGHFLCHTWRTKCVTHDGLSERGTTHSLPQDRQILPRVAMCSHTQFCFAFSTKIPEHFCAYFRLH